jgi:hypothetical protein
MVDRTNEAIGVSLYYVAHTPAFRSTKVTFALVQATNSRTE